jgi:hypothetical protein
VRIQPAVEVVHQLKVCGRQNAEQQLKTKNQIPMKLSRLFASVLVLCSLVTLSSCQKNDIDETGSSTSPNLSFRGGLAFHVVDGSGNDIQGVTISIALTQSELNSGTYLATRVTDGNGKVDFGLLNQDNYYYRADVTINNIPYHGEGVVQVQGGENLSQELTLE